MRVCPIRVKMVAPVPIWPMTSAALVYRDGLERIVQTVSIKLAHETYLTLKRSPF